MTEVDVAIIGYDLTGKVLAEQLLSAGHRVAVVDRYAEARPRSRAVEYDHEIKRMFYAMGLADEVDKISRPMGHFTWYSATWQVLHDFDESRPSISGGPSGFFLDQHALERILEDRLTRHEHLVRRLGFEALAVEERGDHAEITLAPFDQDAATTSAEKPRLLTARFVVGADGAASITRAAIGSEWRDFGGDQDWLVVDVEPTAPNLDLPDAAQWCNPARPTRLLPAGVKNRRWEFMVLPGENPEGLARPEAVWRLLSDWMTPDDGVLLQHDVHTFQTRLARGWRRGRLLIAGQAAHLLPPVSGQGMSSDLRDVWMLSWLLDRVLKGTSPDTLLDSYEPARAPHVEALIQASLKVDELLCMTDPASAAGRDASLLRGERPPQVKPPDLSGGLLRDKDPVAGRLMPHDKVGAHRLDDLTGRAFALLLRPGAQIIPAQEKRLAALGVVPITAHEGRLAAVLAETGRAAILVRPDFYAYGSASDIVALPSLLDDLEAALG
ncbi:MAG TPA: monooxygenase [Maritimibacter sp.]|nr:monooxygenase [Maritimibacter sp.]